MKHILSVCDTGAIPDSDQTQTAAFQQALDEIFRLGGGIVEVPPGVYTVGGLRIRSGTTLLLRSGAKICGSRDPEDYAVLETDTLEPLPQEERTGNTWERARIGIARNYEFMRAGGRWNHAIFRAYGAENISVIGEQNTLIDGCDPYDERGEEHYRGPHGFNFHRCRNVTFSGYTVANTGNWAHAVFHSENIVCKNVTVLGGHDGIHLTGCSNIRIEDCGFYTGDDCVAGFGNLNTVVENCICNTACSGFRFGGTNLLVENCDLYGPAKYFFRGSLTKEEKMAGARVASAPRTNMLSFFTYYADHSFAIPLQPGNLVFRNCTVRNADRFLHYNFSGNEPWQLNRPLRSVRFEGITAEGITMPLTAYGHPDVPLSLELRDVHLSFAPEMREASAFRVAYCAEISLDHVTVDGARESIRSWSEAGSVKINGIPAPERVIRETGEFSCKPI